MARFVLRKLGFFLISLLAVSLLIFVVTEILPSDASSITVGQRATAEVRAAARTVMGLDRPAPVRYLEWLGRVVRGNWGESLYYKVPVQALVLRRLENSLLLAGAALLFGAPLGVIAGVIAGVQRDRWPDLLVSVFSLVAVSLPSFVVTTLLMVIFAGWLRWLPPTSMIDPDTNPLTAIRFLVLPTAALVLGMFAPVARQTRNSMVEVMRSAYIRMALLKGLPIRSVIFRHALRNAMLPSITVIATSIGYMVGGSLIVEMVFSYPGVGRLLLSALTYQDLPLLQAITLTITMIFMGTNVVADLLVYSLNPRARTQS